MNVRDVPFILLCGGRNARLDVLSGTIYKPFLKLRETTIVAQHAMRARLIGHEIIRIVTDHHDPLVQAAVDAIGRDVGGDVSSILAAGNTREKILAVLAALGSAGPAAVALGDTYAWYDTRDLLSRIDDRVACCLAFSEYRLPFGVLEHRDGLVTAFREKPLSGYLVNLGVMALGPDAIGQLAAGHSVAGLLELLAAEGRLAGSQVEGGFLTVDALEDIARAVSPAHPWQPGAGSVTG